MAVPGSFLESKRPLREEAPEEPREDFREEFTRKISALETKAEMLTELVAHERGRAAAAETELKAVREQITDLRIGEAIARTRAQGAETEAERLRRVVDRLTAWPGAAAVGRLREVWRRRRAQ